MENQIFMEGVAPGGLIHSLEIKILICYLLNQLKTPFSKDEIAHILQREGLANYFGIIQAVTELLQSGDLEVSDQDAVPETYKITSLGKDVIDNFAKTLPYMVKQKALLSADRMMLENKSKTENQAKIIQVQDGYLAECRVLDTGSDLMKLTLFTGTKEQAIAVTKQFLKNPLQVYQLIINGLLE